MLKLPLGLLISTAFAGRRSRLGWVSFADALLGLFLPWILLAGWINY